MRLLYAVCGEGSGHATRSKVSLDHLVARGHDVVVAASSQAESYLKPHHRVVPIAGVGMRSTDGCFDLRRTVEENAQRLPRILAENARTWATVELFAPEAVVTDFDFFGWSFARAKGLPLLSIDNGLAANVLEHDPSVLTNGQLTFLRQFNRMMVADADHYIVTTFFYPPVRQRYAGRVTLVPPILRPEVLQIVRNPPPAQDHILVYKSSYVDDDSILRPLAALSDTRFVAYGLKDDAALPPNVTRRPFDQDAFLRDVASARAIVSNGGMSLIGESLALGKPIYAVPLRGQFEQVVNAAYLRKLGYGSSSEALDPLLLRVFLTNLPRHEAAIRAAAQHDENRTLRATLDSLLVAPRYPSFRDPR